jgi:hypothetical protein
MSMRAFLVRLLSVVWVTSIFIDLQYGGPNWGTVLIGILFISAFIYWLKGRRES